MGDSASADFRADQDGDGLDNGLEVLLGLNVHHGDEELPTMHQVMDGGSLYMEIEIVLDHAQASQLRWHFDRSFDLQDWTSLNVIPSTISVANGLRTVRLRDPLPIDQTQKRALYRLRIEPDEF